MIDIDIVTVVICCWLQMEDTLVFVKIIVSIIVKNLEYIEKNIPSQLEWKIGLAWANTRGSLNSPS